MVSRSYDVILTINDATNWETTNSILGSSSGAFGYIAAIDSANNILKVKSSNALVEFISGETVYSNVTGYANRSDVSSPESLSNFPFEEESPLTETTTASGTISTISPSGYIAAKNSFIQSPIVRMFTIYYPGEWFPPRESGNPGAQGEGRAWPSGMPLRLAQILGDYATDVSYNVVYRGDTYLPYPLNIDGIDEGSDGKINEVTVDLYNEQGIISALVENPYLSGNSNYAVFAHVNGELVSGIDPRTVLASPSDLGSPGDSAYDALAAARVRGHSYDPAIVNFYGQANATMTREQAIFLGGTWENDTFDSRDLVGGVVSIKSTFAHFLDYWPEYSLATSVGGSSITVKNGMPYRPGDTVILSSNTLAELTISSITDNQVLNLTGDIPPEAQENDAVYILNEEADPDAFVEDNFKINQLRGLNDDVAIFGLVSWLQYFKVVLPKRRFYKNTCVWRYKGPECQYAGSNYFDVRNKKVYEESEDECSKSLEACKLRRNEKHFGGFPGTGRTVPIA